MIQWGEDKRKSDPSFFCDLAVNSESTKKDVWIISDARRLTDIEYFRRNFSSETITVRIECDLSIRKERGLIFTKGMYTIGKGSSIK